MSTQSYFARFYNLIFGPTVYRIHRSRNGNPRGYDFPQNGLMDKSQFGLNIASVSKQVACFTSPVWTILFYRRGYFNIETAFEATKFAGYAAFTLLFVLILRAFGRLNNQEYLNFLDVLETAKKHREVEYKKALRAYDFDFHHWPVDFRWDEVEDKKQHSKSSFWQRVSNKNSSLLKTSVIDIPKELAAYIVAHTFGIRMMYPGCTTPLRLMIDAALKQNRNKLVEEQEGWRAKLLARDGNEIDTMFLDRRERGHPKRIEPDNGPLQPSRHGNTLVICCEGNAGFYEVGCMCTPIQCGYSVLGWNHPGFGGSTGQPFPDADHNAIDVVMQYAIHKLGFKPEDIMLFGWSIGCFSLINAANTYPDISGILLDSTFYDVLPFAKKLMPDSLEGFVTYTVRNHLNLHNSENLKKYKGPVSFVRRMQDEVMNLDGPGRVQSNLGNLLLESFLRHRFPGLFDSSRASEDEPGKDAQSRALWEWLLAHDQFDRETVLQEKAVNVDECKVLLGSYISENSSSFPMLIGEGLTSEQKTQLVLYLANQHMHHFHSTHCTPLPSAQFHLPWNIESVANRFDSGSDDSGSSSSCEFELVGGNPSL
uniref:Abhydrolase domain-containing protein 16A-like n=1 Tax=Phallusia mammillata TaxID=59560 RepID=A0A6F9D5D2_9ASCI|nr:abhydrolase domain-containing protein 16A-like [Phallusia mammillata]